MLNLNTTAGENISIPHISLDFRCLVSSIALGFGYYLDVQSDLICPKLESNRLSPVCRFINDLLLSITFILILISIIRNKWLKCSSQSEEQRCNNLSE